MKTFGLEKIAPLWAGKIKEKKTLSQLLDTCIREDKVLDLSMNNCCIVGESWKFNSMHGRCKECDNYAMDLWSWVYHNASYTDSMRPFPSSKSFNDALKKFIKHFKKEHM